MQVNITSKTIQTAIRLGFEYADSKFSSKEEFENDIIDFLNENSDKIKKVEKHFCEVTGGRNQHVSFGDYWADGEIVDWSYYYHKRKQRIYHSDFIDYKEDGTPVKVLLYCYSK